MKNKIITVTCTPMRFFSPTDEDMCSAWIKKIPSIIKDYGVFKSLHLELPLTIPDADLIELRGLFMRYHFKTTQLNAFKTHLNQGLFDWPGYEPVHKLPFINVVKKNKTPLSVTDSKDIIILVCDPLWFFSQNDEILFFKWLKKIPFIIRYEGVGRSLHVTIPKELSLKDLIKMKGLFCRYQFDLTQLNGFKNEENERIFTG